MFDDAFTSCTNVSKGITLFGIMSPDVGPDLFSREINRRHGILVRPDPSNTSLIFDELIKDMDTITEEGMTLIVSKKCHIYRDLRNMVRRAPTHQFFLGIIKTDIWGGFFKLLDPIADVQWFRRYDERKKFARRDAIPDDVVAICAYVVYVDVHTLMLLKHTGNIVVFSMSRSMSYT
jgi:hypothetical protein